VIDVTGDVALTHYVNFIHRVAVELTRVGARRKMLTLILISLATASMTLTISKSKFFSWPRSLLPAPLAVLVRCHYCLGHWIAFMWSLGFHPLSLYKHHSTFEVFMLQWMATVAMASFMMGLILLVVPMRGDVDVAP